MPKTNGYVKRAKTPDKMHVDLQKDVSQMVEIYCKIKNLNKTKFVNSVLREYMENKFAKIWDDTGVQTKLDI